MANDTNDPRKEKLLIVAILGLMSGVALYTIVKAMTNDSVRVFPVLLPVMLVFVFLVRRLVEIRKARDVSVE